MATVAEIESLRRLVGAKLPEGGGEPVAYTDAELAAYLAAYPLCSMTPHGADVYRAAADVWEDKALQREQELLAAGQGPLVTAVSQGDASVDFARPTPMGATTGTPNDPTAMRALAARLRRRSCNRSVSVDVLPPNIVQPGARGIRDWNGGDSIYGPGRPVIMDAVTNPDRAINFPEVD